jgi:predicted DNA-binding protein YlxM (UPF0122 family)
MPSLLNFMPKGESFNSSQQNDTKIRRLIELYESGLSMREVGARFSITRQRVEQILKKAGIRTRKFTISDKFLEGRKRKRKILPKELLLKFYRDEKLPIAEIRRRLNTNSNSLYKSLKFHNIPKRGAEGNQSSKWSKDVLRRLYLEEDLTAVEIARKLGFAPNTIKKRLSEFGIKKRDRQT